MIDSLRGLRFPFLVLPSFLALNPLTTNAGNQIIWQIGTFDEASIEFSRQIDYANPAEDPVYEVGKSVATKDWRAYQPGSANGQAGLRPHPFTIQFDLPAAPTAAYGLTVGLLTY